MNDVGGYNARYSGYFGAYIVSAGGVATRPGFKSGHNVTDTTTNSKYIVSYDHTWDYPGKSSIPTDGNAATIRDFLM